MRASAKNLWRSKQCGTLGPYWNWFRKNKETAVHEKNFSFFFIFSIHFFTHRVVQQGQWNFTWFAPSPGFSGLHAVGKLWKMSVCLGTLWHRSIKFFALCSESETFVKVAGEKWSCYVPHRLWVLNCSVNVLLKVNSLWIGHITTIHPEKADVGERFILYTNDKTTMPFRSPWTAAWLHSFCPSAQKAEDEFVDSSLWYSRANWISQSKYTWLETELLCRWHNCEDIFMLSDFFSSFMCSCCLSLQRVT